MIWEINAIFYSYVCADLLTLVNMECGNCVLCVVLKLSVQGDGLVYPVIDSSQTMVLICNLIGLFVFDIWFMLIMIMINAQSFIL